MSKSTISTFQLFALIPNAEAARQYLEARLWPTGVSCPTCTEKKRITAFKNRKGLYVFTIFGDNKATIQKDNDSRVILIEEDLYTPIECFSYGTRCVNDTNLYWDSDPNFKSSEIASYSNYSPLPLPQNSLLYRAAVAIEKLRMSEASKPAKPKK